MPIDAMPTQVRRARPKVRAERHRQARINAANAGDNWAIQWPAEEVKSLTYWEKQSEQWADRRARSALARLDRSTLEEVRKSGNVPAPLERRHRHATTVSHPRRVYRHAL